MSVAGYFREPFGPGWALAGDAGYNKDFISAMGILDAFRDAELCATALDEAFSGRRTFDEAMLGYQQARDEQALPIYEFPGRVLRPGQRRPHPLRGRPERLRRLTIGSPRTTALIDSLAAFVMRCAK